MIFAAEQAKMCYSRKVMRYSRKVYCISNETVLNSMV